jgi:hypothetical protein
MTKSLMAVAGASLAVAAAANADLTFNVGGPYVFTGGQSITFLTTPIVGTLTGISVTMNYSGAAGGSWVADTAVTVDALQWGGYDIFMNGATNYMGGISGFPNSGAAGNYSGTGGGANVVYNGGTALVGIGNGYSFASSSMTLTDIVITLHGVEKVPGPGAVALLGLAGLTTGRRRRA